MGKLNFGLSLLFFLPVFESFNRQFALILLLGGSIVIFKNIKNSKNIQFDAINWLFFLLVMWSFFTTIFSLSISRSYIDSCRYFAYFLIFISIRINTVNRDKYFKFFKSTVILNSLVLSFLFIFYSIFNINFQLISGMNMFIPVFGHNRIDSILIFTIPLILSLLFQSTVKYYEKIFKLLFIFFIIIIAFSFGRASWLSLSIGLYLSLFLIPIIKNRLKKVASYLFYIFLAITVIIFAYSNFFVSKNNGVYNYLGLFKPVFHEKRIEYYKQALIGFSISPIIGSGLDSFRYISKKYQEYPSSWSWYTHNHFVQIIIDTGIIGGTFFFLLFFLLIQKSISKLKQYRNININHSVFISLLPSIIHSCLDYDWQFLSILLIVFSGFGLLVPVEKEIKNISRNLIKSIAIFFFTIAVGLSFFDSDKLIVKGDLKLLKLAEKLDSSYNEIYKKRAEIYIKEKKYNLAHKDLKRAILLDPLDSINVIKTDYLLYLEEAYEKNNLSIINEAYNYYPYFQDKYILKYSKKENLQEYIEGLKKWTENNSIRIWELKEILKNPYFIN